MVWIKKREKRKLILLFYRFFRFLKEARSVVHEFHFEYTRNITRRFFALCGFLSITTLTIEYGFYYNVEWAGYIWFINSVAINYLISYEILGLIFSTDSILLYIKKHKPEVIIVSLVILQKFFEQDIINYLQLGEFGTKDTALVFLSINQIFLVFSNFARLVRNTRLYNLKKLNPSLIFLFSFASIGIIGTALLSLPKAEKLDIRLIDIIFTVISATCVTGLSTISIVDSFTVFGQIIILILIQVGGLGLITLTTFFSIFLAGQASVNDKLLMKDLLSEEAIGRVRKIIKQIAIQTLIIEAIGALILYNSLPNEANLSGKDKIFFSIFHSISAFCNAGFSLFPNGLAESFFDGGKLYLIVIMLLITFGGLGFPVVGEIARNLFTPENVNVRLSVFSKLVIIISFSFFIIGATSYYFLEENYTLKGLPLSEKIFHSIFYSITTRTAGFNTLAISDMGTPMVFFSFLLMWVGASPNSTGGGIKTSTFAVSFLHIFDLVKGRNRLDIFNRTISPASISRASATIVLSLFVIFIAIFSMVVVESFPFLDICFEVVSAFGTVGLTRGITPNLSDSSKIVISIVMFMGRVGVLTILIAFSPKSKVVNYRYPVEYVVVG
ncbi:MAG: portal protein [Leptospiraceae bacterium]|nr:portal protein [Leptospiraceae bacterium]